MTRRGDIVLVQYPFTNRTSSKVRPAIVLTSDDIIDRQPDVVVGFISSRIPKTIEATDYVLREGNPGFPNTGLKKASVFKMHKITILPKRLLKKKIGSVDQSTQGILNQKLGWALGLVSTD